VGRVGRAPRRTSGRRLARTRADASLREDGLLGTPSVARGSPPSFRSARCHLPRPAAPSRGGIRLSRDRTWGCLHPRRVQHLPGFDGEVSSEHSERDGGAVRTRTAHAVDLETRSWSELLRTPSDACSSPPSSRCARCHLPRPAAQSRGGVVCRDVEQRSGFNLLRSPRGGIRPSRHPTTIIVRQRRVQRLSRDLPYAVSSSIQRRRTAGRPEAPIASTAFENAARSRSSARRSSASSRASRCTSSSV
jgi:hypothetical protein